MKKPTRTQKDKYGKVNRQAAHRNSFCYRAAWSWLKDNNPKVMSAIAAEAYKRWPPARTRPNAEDYSFLSKLKVAK